MKKIIIASVLALLSMIIGFYWFFQKDDSIPNESLNEGKIEVAVGEEFSRTLESNPTTGYVWKPSFNEQLLELKSNEFFPKDNGNLVGSGGIETFIFEALKPGNTEIVFSYVRPWEGESSDTSKRVYRVIIR